MAEPRKEKSKNTKGSLILIESTKVKRTTLSTTVPELHALMKCYGTCQMLRGLIKDIIGLSSEIHMRTDANNLVTTASTTHVPEQQETIHMIQMLRKEACSGSIADLSHIRTQWCLADCLTKKSANPQNLIDAVRQGVLKEGDAHPPFRSLLEHKAYLRSWLPTVCSHVDFRHDVFLLGDTLRDSWLFFEFVPAAPKAVESRISHCFSPCRALTGGRAPQPQKHKPHCRVEDDRIFQIHNMMMRRDTDRHQGDMLRERSRKSLLKTREHHAHYQQKIIWRSVQDIDMRQHGFKLRRDGGRNVNATCTSSWDQTTCQVLIDIKCSWM